MSDVFLSSQQQLTQALTQLGKTAAASPLLKQAAEVIVQHLAGNQLNLTGKEGRQVTLPARQLQGQVLSGQAYLTKISLQQSQNLLLFFAPAGKPAETQTLTLSHNQLQGLLQVIDKPLLAQTGAKPMLAEARVTQVSGNTVSLRVPLADQSVQLQVKMPAEQPKPQPGQQLQVQLVPAGKHWQVSLLPQSQLDKATNINPARQPARIPLETKPAQLNTLLLSAIQSGKSSAPPVSVALALPALLQQLQTAPSQLPKELVSSLQQSHVQQVSLSKQSASELVLTIQHNKPVAKLPLPAEIPDALKTLKLPEVSDQKGPAPAPVQPRPQQALSLQPAPELTQSIQTLLRRAQALSDSPSKTLERIESALGRIDKIHEPANKLIIQQLLEQVKQAPLKGSEQDAAQIKQLLTSPAALLSSKQPFSPPANQGLLGGLISLLQISLATRLVRNRPKLAESVIDALNQQLPKGAPAKHSKKSLAEFGQSEQRLNLLKDIGRALVNHQMNKLSSAEQSLQGQDSLYYMLPGLSGDQNRDIELLIRREPDARKGKEAAPGAQRVWHLTMKLDVGEAGQLLAKAKLRQEQLDVDFYASNEQVKKRAMEHMPLLKKRLKRLGIQIDHSSCQLGKIPSNLASRPHQIFQAQA